ncbi:unnamed protein product [Linum tenue]|uniref:Nudix hydrolase domain-containing protein n=1 Tax=Linum tenue TaxID=586396 RepID=A0AAV0JP67_9ROSI|nr:unnamed protein product [Linum tenue]
MAICRTLLSYSQLHRPPRHQMLSTIVPTLSFSNYPPKLHEFTKLPPLYTSLKRLTGPLELRTLSASSSSSSSSSMESPPEGYRRNVGICLINPSKKIFAASRLDVPDSWQMPQGGIDENEDPKAAALRELKEETGVSSAEILAEAPHWLTYDFPPQVREKLNQQWGTDWKGQAQKWFLLKFTGKEEEEINLLGDGSEKPEFGEWSWMSAEEVIDRAVDFKKPVYKEVFGAFHPHLQ